MKKIVCELCECMEFTKEGGMFVCNSCGTKYTAEEARGMMREVEGAAPAVTGGAPAAAPMGNPNQQQLDNILLLASSAYEADNKTEAENYCNQAIVMDAMCYKAWFLKGKAVGWQSKIDNLRIEEAAHSFCKAIDFAPEEEKEDLKKQAVDEIKKLGLALISLRKNRFSGSPDKEELNGFTSDKKVLLDSLLVLLSHGNAVGMPEGYLEEVATLMNQAGVAALNFVRKAWGGVEHPSKKDWDTYIGWTSNIAEVFRQAIKTSDDDDEEDIVRYKNLIIAIEEPIGSCSWKREWVSYASEYRWFKDYSLADSAITARKAEVAKCKQEITKIENKIAAKKAAEAKKAEEAKQARIKAYWDAHKEEKDKLESEKKQLSEKKKSLDTQINDLFSQIKAIEAEGTAKVPSDIEADKIRDQISELNTRKSKLGLFAGKEKKQIAEEIAALEGRMSALRAKAEEEKKALAEEVNKKVSPLKQQKDKLEKEKATANKRISAIDAELTKDPE